MGKDVLEEIKEKKELDDKLEAKLKKHVEEFKEANNEEFGNKEEQKK